MITVKHPGSVLQTEPIQSSELAAAVQDSTYGACVLFEGRVRHHHLGRQVAHLFYEAYELLAIAELDRIREEARKQFGTGPILVSHRHGKLMPGEIAVVVAAFSAHRAEAFAAAQMVMDEIKQRVPIWKKETYADGSEEWVFCTHGHAKNHKQNRKETGNGCQAHTH